MLFRVLFSIFVFSFSTIITGEEKLDCDSALKIIPNQISFEISDNGHDYQFTTIHHKKNLKCEEIANGFEFKTLFATTTIVEQVDTGVKIQYQHLSFKLVNKQIIYNKTHINNFPMAMKSYIFDEKTSHTWVMLNSGFIVRVNGRYKRYAVPFGKL